MIFDVHCHLNLVEKETDIKKVIEDAKKNELIIVSNGIDVETNRKMLDYKKEYDNVLICLGIYPEHILSMKNEDIELEIDFIEKNKNIIAGIGEVGIDLSKEDYKEGIDKQKNYFSKFVELSIRINKPITVHSRKAEEICIEILEKLKAKKVVMHYFSGKMSLVKRIIENGWTLSIPTAVKNLEHFQKVIDIAPIEQLLCETDSPYSHPDKKFPNNPNNVITSYEMIAKIKKISLEDTKIQIEKNFNNLF